MTQGDTDNPTQTAIPAAGDAAGETRDNLTRLLNLGRRGKPRISRSYSAFVRLLRLALPLAALALVAIVVAWPSMEDAVIPLPDSDLADQADTAQNELIDPRFESTDDNLQPYVITATRAVQSRKDEALILMDQPKADVTLEKGDMFHAQSLRGAYRQDTEILVMDDNVILQHDSGYRLESEQMSVSMKDHYAWTDLPVSGTGPSATLEAQAMTANNITGKIIFAGPAILIITQTEKGLLP